MSFCADVRYVIMREYSEYRNPPRTMDMQCPCPDTEEELESFVEEFFSNDYHWISNIMYPKWLFQITESDFNFFGEMLLLAYPSLEKIPDYLGYSRKLLEQYTLENTCKLTTLPLPFCIERYTVSFGYRNYPYDATFLKMMDNLDSRLSAINLTHNHTVSAIYTDTTLSRVINKKFPNLQHLEIDFDQLSNESLMAQMNLLQNKNLEFTCHLNWGIPEDSFLGFCDWWNSLPLRRKNLIVTTGLPLRSSFAGVSQNVTKLTVSSGFPHEPPTPVTLPALKILAIKRDFDFYPFMRQFILMGMPVLETLEITSLLGLQQLPTIMGRINGLRHFEARKLFFLKLLDPPSLCDGFKSNFRARATRRSLKLRKGLEDWRDPYDSSAVDEELPEDWSDDGVSIGSSEPMVNVLNKAMLRRDLYVRETKLLLRQILTTVSSQSELVTLEVALYTVGGFTAALLRFLLKHEKRECQKLRVLAVALQGGLFVSMVPVVCGLARNWRELAIAFWCPAYLKVGAKRIVEAALDYESKNHSSLEILVNCEDSVIYGHSVNGKQKVRVFTGVEGLFLFGDLQIDANALDNLLGQPFDGAKAKLVDISTLALRAVSGWVPGSSQFNVARIADACDHRTSSSVKVQQLIERMNELDILEFCASSQLFRSLLD
ncbi:hypothetical protein HDE_12468 [Halotydeus destructor]|nr:hypothetical protein HDE_12468 [Halotydeus destructor]